MNKIKYEDKTLSIKERQKEYNKEMDKLLNPIPVDEFDPEDFDICDNDMKRVANRKRTIPPKKLPLFGLKPKVIREGQMIGMYESKQDLYLIFAHRCNELQLEIDELKKIINDLKVNNVDKK